MLAHMPPATIAVADRPPGRLACSRRHNRVWHNSTFENFMERKQRESGKFVCAPRSIQVAVLVGSAAFEGDEAEYKINPMSVALHC
jgi:hypothetical protein